MARSVIFNVQHRWRHQSTNLFIGRWSILNPFDSRNSIYESNRFERKNPRCLGSFFLAEKPSSTRWSKVKSKTSDPPPHSIVDHGAGNSDAISSVFCFSCARHFYGATNSPRNALEINKRESAERDESLRSRETEIRSIPSTSTHKKKKKTILEGSEAIDRIQSVIGRTLRHRLPCQSLSKHMVFNRTRFCGPRIRKKKLGKTRQHSQGWWTMLNYWAIK